MESSTETEKFLQLKNAIWTSGVTKYLGIMDAFYFYCINKKYYEIYVKEFQANVQAWVDENFETLQNFLGKQERVESHFKFDPWPHCEFIVIFPSAKCYATFTDETWECKFTIKVHVESHKIPRLILEEDNVKSELFDASFDLEDENAWDWPDITLRRFATIGKRESDEELMTITISNTGIVTYKFAYNEISKIEIHGLRLHWKPEKHQYEFSDSAGNKFGYPEGFTSIFAHFFGSHHKLPKSVQFEFPNCSFYKK